MHEFMLNIDNKEILIEVLHHSVDILIGSCQDNSVLTKSSHKYGFAKPEEFESAILLIANAIKLYMLNILTETEFLAQFSHMNQDLQQSVLDVVKARKPELAQFLLREFNSRDHKLLLSLDWDIKFIFGDSYNPSLRRQIATLSINCLDSSDEKNPKTSTTFFEMDKNKVEEFIEVLESLDKILNTVPVSENN